MSLHEIIVDAMPKTERDYFAVGMYALLWLSILAVGLP